LASGEEAATTQGQVTQKYPKDEREIYSSLDTVFLVSYDHPQTLVSAKARVFCRDKKHAYIGCGDKICAINMESQNGKKTKWFKSWNESGYLSPLIHVGRISFASPTVQNNSSDAGSCYVMPAELPPLEEHRIKNLPAHMKVAKCTAMSQNGKLLLSVYDELERKHYYVFYDVATSSADQKYYEISDSGNQGLIWNDNYV